MKRKIFPLPVFIITFTVLAILTTGQMVILGRYIDYQTISTSYIIGVIVYWMIGATFFTLLTGYQINVLYERPMMRFANATKQVANGDFSVYVKPLHTADKMNYMDQMFLDFNTMVEQLGSMETLKTDFFANVSHEIKTPLAIIQNSAELLPSGEYKETILNASHRLSELINNLLKLNKLEKQTMTPIEEPFDVCRQLCDCILNFESQWDAKNIELDVDIDDTAYIMADPSLMELVWNNLLSNAIKFTNENGSINITQKSTDDMIIVTVSDTGCGMDESTLSHIFDKFYQGDTSHSTEGNGLGLALVQRILQLMDCTITVTSELNIGSEFTVTIPIYTGGEV